MTGYMFVMGQCFGCKAPMTFNADKVPSIRIDGKRQPICSDCVERVNPQRRANGLDPIAVHPNAYEPEQVT